jgi:hypothetical protein
MNAPRPRAAIVDELCRQGLALHHAGRIEEARECYKKALRRDPGHFQALHLLGTLCVRAGQTELGVSLIRRAIRVDPSVAEAHCLLGAALNELERPREALASYDRAVALKPNYPEAHYNAGVTLAQSGLPAAAIGRFDAALALRSDYANAHYNRGRALHDLNRLDAALTSYDRAVALRPQHAESRFNRALALLQSGQFETGWREYEWRKRQWARREPAIEAAPLWLGGEDLTAKRILLHHEQGLGDTIQFCRYLDLFDRSRTEVVLKVQPPLKSLLDGFMPGIEVLSDGDALRRIDYQCPLLSLPLAFGTRLETIPSPRCYLQADAGRKAAFASRLGSVAGPRIGLVWSGAPSHLHDAERSIAFERLEPALTDGAAWTCLQNVIRNSDRPAFDRIGRVGFHGAALSDFSQTAALIDLMDLVITVDTSVAHLAGALGKPVWILLPFCPDWRWLSDRADSPWYPSARLFRQRAIGDWDSAIEDVREGLRSLIGCGDVLTLNRLA